MDINTIFIIVIVVMFFVELAIVNVLKAKHKLVTYKRVVDYFPSSLSTMGVLGTFIGIYLGLQEFDPRNIQASIPVLLDGLKTAFSTSLCGMGLSLIFSFIINILTDLDEEDNPTEFDKLAIKISESVDKMSTTVVNSMERVRQQIDKQTQNIQNNHRDISKSAQELTAIREKINLEQFDINSLYSTVSSWSLDEKLKEVKDLLDNINTELGACRAIGSRSKESLEIIVTNDKSRTDNLHKFLENSLNLLNNKIEEVNAIYIKRIEENIKAFREQLLRSDEFMTQKIKECDETVFAKIKECESVLNARVLECDKLLDQKLTTFGQSIAKSNTEALSSVMKSACNSFELTMNGMIKELVSQNFAELNTNIKQLNDWQSENLQLISDMTNRCQGVISLLDTAGKSMTDALRKNVDKLTTDLTAFTKDMNNSIASQYGKMSSTLKESTDSLAKVAQSTQEINGAEGELGALVSALQKVVISDQSFVNVSRNLTTSIAKNSDNIELLNNVTLNLKNWMTNGQKMQDEIRTLISELMKLNSLKDINSQFWVSTKSQLEEGVRVLQSGSVELTRQLNNIDQHFYDRLSVTLANLDECLTKMIESKEERSII